jgi:DNA-binding transcriptional MocR family regulator
MSLRRRHELVHLARKHDALVVSDDVYDSLQWPVCRDQRGAHTDASPVTVLSRLCDIDIALGPTESDPSHFGHTVSNGSFSKVVAPGVRTGWAEGTRAFAYGLSQTGSTRSGGSPSQFTATVLCKLLRDGSMDSHIRAVIVPALQRRHRVLLDALAMHLAPLGIECYDGCHGQVTHGGYFAWLSLPVSLDSQRIAEFAEREENLIIGHGKMFEVRGDEEAAPFRHHIRLSFSWESEEALVEGVRRLGDVIKLHLGELSS